MALHTKVELRTVKVPIGGGRHDVATDGDVSSDTKWHLYKASSTYLCGKQTMWVTNIITWFRIDFFKWALI